jgi:hypothetical protein
MDGTCGFPVVAVACGTSGIGDSSCCTKAWTSTCVAFVEATLGCGDRKPGIGACESYLDRPAPSDANKAACDACRKPCRDKVDCGGLFAEPGLELECLAPFDTTATCECLVKPKLGEGCEDRSSTCCATKSESFRCLSTTCESECAP